MENPIKMDDLGVPPFLETPSTYCRLARIFIDLRYRTCGKMCKLKQWSATSGRDCRVVAAEAEYSSFERQFHGFTILTA